MSGDDQPEKHEPEKGKARGGRARAERLSPEQRQQIASEAAKKRWAERDHSRAPATYKVLEGYANTLNLAGMKLPCAVVEGPNGIQRVLTENGITNAILGSRSGASKRLKKAASEDGALLPLFVAPRQLERFITSDLRDGPLKPIEYEAGGRIVRAYDAAILVAVCKIWLKAREEGELQGQQLAKAQKAEILLGALAETGVVALIDEATGYEKARPQNALQAYLEQIIRKELAAWAKKFPDEYYENIYKLKGWKWPGMGKNRFSVVAHYTNNIVYQRLGPGILDELTAKSPKNEKGNRPNKLHQWLNEDVGNPLLSQHLHSVVMFQRHAIANGHSWAKFLGTLDQVMPKRGSTLELPGLNDPTA